MENAVKFMLSRQEIWNNVQSIRENESREGRGENRVKSRRNVECHACNPRPRYYYTRLVGKHREFGNHPGAECQLSQRYAEVPGRVKQKVRTPCNTMGGHRFGFQK
jgi:hypothetical protein